MVLGQPDVDQPGLDKAIIRRYIKRSVQKLLLCYQDALVKQPDLAGTSVAKFTIGRDGRVSAATASGVPTIDKCVSGVIEAIEFPKPTQPVEVTYPFVFH